jgi:uncharacterized protein
LRPVAVLMSAALLTTGCVPAEWGANAILHPHRRPVTLTPPIAYETLAFENDGVKLAGWVFRAQPATRGWLVYLHGIADNRQSGIGFAQRFVPQGYDVLMYDSRAHGASTGKAVTYGVREKEDLRRALDAVGAKRAVLFGCSLGAAVALQAAAADERIVGVIAQSPFADLRLVAHERKPFVFTRAKADTAIALAGKQGDFDVDDASALRAAPNIRVPVLLIHGEDDRDTRADHSRRIFEKLAGPKELLIVAGAGHNDTLARAETWQRIEDWLARLR